MSRLRRHSPQEVAEDLRDVVSGLRRRVRAESGEEARAMPYPLRSALKRLEVDGPLTTADLARAELITPQSAGALVAELEARGWVVRRDDAKDGRRRIVALTAQGRKALTIGRAERQTWLAQAIATHLDADERKTVATAIVLLRRIVDA